MECVVCGKIAMDRSDEFCSTECKKESEHNLQKKVKTIASFVSVSGKYRADLIQVEDCDSCDLRSFNIEVKEGERMVSFHSIWRTEQDALKYFEEQNVLGVFQPDAMKTPMKLIHG